MKRYLLVLLFLFLCGGLAKSVDEGIAFSRLSVENGLSQGTIFDIVQDRQGNMWFATYDGLNKFDGYKFTVYRNDKNNPSSIQGNIIRSLAIDDDGKIWAGTNAGVSVYNQGTDSFSNIPLGDGEIYIYEIVPVGSERMMLYSDDGFYVVDRASLKMESSFMEGFFSQVGFSVCRGDGGLFMYSPGKGLYFSRQCVVGELEKLSDPFASFHVCNLFLASSGKLYIATDGDGFFSFDRRSGELRHFRANPGDKESLCSNFVRTFEEDVNGNIWVGTGHNLSIFDPVTEKFITVRPEPLREESLSLNSIRAIHRDTQDGMWIGLFYGGINYYNPHRDFFRSLRLDTEEADIVGAVNVSSDDKLWIGTWRSGVYVYDRKNGSTEHVSLFDYESGGGMELNDIKSIEFCDELQEAYIGSELGGLGIFNRRTGRISHIRFDGMPHRIYSILKEKEGLFWVSTSYGLYFFNAFSRKMSPVPIDNPSRPVTIVSKDDCANLWVGGNFGLKRCSFVLDSENRPSIVSVRNYQQACWIQDICVSSSGDVWLATRNGLFVYDKQHDDVVQVLPREKEDNQYILKGIEEDNDGCLWLSSEDGIIRFNPKDGQVRKFSAVDGLLNNGFNQRAHVSVDGTIYFGGLKGITYFVPSQVCRNSFSLDPVITEVKVNGKRIIPSEGMVLKHWQNNISFHFSVPNYVSLKGNKFSFLLQGAEEEWRGPVENREVHYSKLPKGKYRFCLKSCNEDYQWSENVVTMEFLIRPVWYKTLAFLLSIVSLCLVVVVSALMRYSRRMEEERKRSVEQARMESVEEINALKVENIRNYFNAVSPRGKDEDEFILKLNKVVRESLGDEGFSVEELSRLMCMSRSSLHMKMKRVLGVSTLEFIDKIRFDEAKRMLEEDEMTVADIGFKLGFASPAYFATSFKRYCGMSPSEYKAGRNR